MGARVWLVAGLATNNGGDVAATPESVGVSAVRDGGLRVWHRGDDGDWHTADGRHHATWTELHTRFDLVEVA